MLTLRFACHSPKEFLDLRKFATDLGLVVRWFGERWEDNTSVHGFIFSRHEDYQACKELLPEALKGLLVGG